MWYAYERTRGAADALGFPVQVEAMRNIDRLLFFGHDPNVVLQQHFWHATGALVGRRRVEHLLHPLRLPGDRPGGAVGGQPSPVGAVHEALRHRAARRLRDVRRAPDRAAVDGGAEVPADRPAAPRTRAAASLHIGFKGFVHSYNVALGNGNAIAAMPSLHASFALIVPAFFLPWIKPQVAQGVGAGVPGADAHVARVPRRALGDRRARRLGDRRRLVLVLEPDGAPQHAASAPGGHASPSAGIA